MEIIFCVSLHSHRWSALYTVKRLESFLLQNRTRVQRSLRESAVRRIPLCIMFFFSFEFLTRDAPLKFIFIRQPERGKNFSLLRNNEIILALQLPYALFHEGFPGNSSKWSNLSTRWNLLFENNKVVVKISNFDSHSKSDRYFKRIFEINS